MTITTTATAADFANWRKRAKSLSDSALDFVIRDCREAADAMRGWNPEREGYYSDQGSTFADERHARQMKARKTTLKKLGV